MPAGTVVSWTRNWTQTCVPDGMPAGGYQISERNVDVHVAALRRKLGDHNTMIATVRGIGYKFKDDSGD